MNKLFKKIKKMGGRNKGEIELGTQILLFLLALFIIWLLLGGAQKPIENKSLFLPINPLN